MAEDDGIKTVIGADTLINGTVRAEAEIAIYGKVVGEVLSSDTVIIEDGGLVEATINAPWVIVSGAVVGDIVATEKLEILETGRIIGDIRALNIVMVEGGAVSGRVIIGADFAESAGIKAPQRTQSTRTGAPLTKSRPRVETSPRGKTVIPVTSKGASRAKPVQSELIDYATKDHGDED